MNLIASNFLNSIFGIGALGEGLGRTCGTGMNSTSPFASLLGSDGEAPKNSKGLLAGTLSNNIGFAKIEDLQEDTSDLSSPDLLLSDLLSVNWQALQKGDSLALSSGWTISVNQDGSMALAQPDGEMAFPSFTPEQLQEVLDQFKSAGTDFMPLMKEDEKPTPGEVKKEVREQHLKEKAEATAQKDSTPVSRDIATLKAKISAGGIGVVSNKDIVIASTAPVVTATSAVAVEAASAANPLQPLLVAAQKEQAVREAYLFASTSVYASTGARASVDTSAKPALFSAPVKTAAAMNTAIDGQTVSIFTAADAHDEGAFFVPDMMEGEGNYADAAPLPALLQQSGIRIGTDGQLYGSNPVSTAQLNLIVQKMAERPDTRVLTVRLDPPELGRVQVQLSAGSDKIVRAAITVEKSEALTMLKKDLASLEKALQDAGISVDKDGITLDLAMDNNSNGQGFWAQQAFQDMWSENNAARMRSGTDVANNNLDEGASAVEEDEFYQTDLAVNIKV